MQIPQQWEQPREITVEDVAEAAAPVEANPEPARIGTIIAAAEANPTTTDSSKKTGTRMGINPVPAVVEIRVKGDVLIRVTEEIGRSTGIRDSKDRAKDDSTEIVPVVLEDKTGNAVSLTEGINRSIGTSKVRRNDLGRKRVREIDNVKEGIGTDHNMAKRRGSRIASTETREGVASVRHLIRTRRMAAAAVVEASGTTSHVAKMNITTKNRGKIWTTSSRRSRRS